VAILLLPVVLGACAGDDSRESVVNIDNGTADQPFPENHRGELLAFMKTYLNNPVGVHDASVAEPVMRTVGGRQRYVSCLRYTAREADGSYRNPRERPIVYVNGRLDHMADNAAELCAGATYAPYPDLEHMTR